MSEASALQDMLLDLSINVIHRFVDGLENSDVASARSTQDFGRRSQRQNRAAAFQELPRTEIAKCNAARPCDLQCSICLEAWSPSDVAPCIPCGHLFHEACAEEWCKRSSQCPVCRAEFFCEDPELPRP